MESVANLLDAGEPVYFTLQNIGEFWNVATRPLINNGLGFSEDRNRDQYHLLVGLRTSPRIDR